MNAFLMTNYMPPRIDKHCLLVKLYYEMGVISGKSNSKSFI